MVDEHKPENPEDAVRRMVAEEEELSTDPLVSDPENAVIVKAWLKQKHDAEFDTGAPFESILDAQRYDAHKNEGEQFSADTRIGRAVGEIIPVGEKQYVYMGVDEHDRGVLRPLRAAPEVSGEWQALPDITFSVTEELADAENAQEANTSEQSATERSRRPILHVPRTAPAPDMVGEVFAEMNPDDEVTVGEASSERWRGIVDHINRIDILAGDKQRAIRALRNGKELGLTTKANNLEQSLAKFPKDESTMPEAQIEEKRRVTEAYESMIGREKKERDDAEFFNRAMYDEIAHVLRNFDQLPEELQGGIREGKDEIFRKYDINPWAAGQVAEALKEEEYEEARQLHAVNVLEDRLRQDRISGRTTWQTIASVIDTPQFALFSRDDIERALAERNIPTDDIARGIEMLREQYAAELKGTMPQRKTYQVPAGTFVRGSSLSGLYEVRDGHVYNVNDTEPDAVKLDEVTIAEPAGGVSEPVQQERMSAPLVERWNAGHEEYSQFTDAERHADAQFERIVKLWRMKSAKQKPLRYKKVKATADPALTGIYEETGDAIVSSAGAEIIKLAPKATQENAAVKTSDPVQFSPEVESLLQPLSEAELKELSDMKEVDVDPTFTKEAVEGLQDRQMNKYFAPGNRITINEGTLASDALSTRQSVLATRAKENIIYGEELAKTGRTTPLEMSSELREGRDEQHADLEQSPSIGNAINAQNEIYDHAPSIITEAIARNNAMLDQQGSFDDALAARNVRLDKEPTTVTPEKDKPEKAEKKDFDYHLNGARDFAKRNGGITLTPMLEEGATQEEAEKIMAALIAEGVVDRDGKLVSSEAAPVSPSAEATVAPVKVEVAMGNDSSTEYYNAGAGEYLESYVDGLLEDAKGSTPEEQFASIKEEVERDAAMALARGKGAYADTLLTALPLVRARLFPQEQHTPTQKVQNEAPMTTTGATVASPEVVVQPVFPADSFQGVQQDYFSRSSAITAELGEASLRGDAKRVGELQAERRELEAWYGAEVRKYSEKTPYELDEIGSLWASFIEREYGLDVNGDPINGKSEKEEEDAITDKVMADTAELWSSFYEREHGIDIFSAPEKTIAIATAATPAVGAPTGEVSAETAAVIDIDPSLMDPETINASPEEEEPAAVEDIPETRSSWDPEIELEKILKAPTSERKALLLQYKEKLAWQKLGLAKVQQQMVDEIRNAPDMTEDEFARLFIAKADSYQATKEQLLTGLAAFRKYKKKHDIIEQYADAFRDPREAYKVCFGADPIGEVEMIKGPASLYFRCHNDEDYARIYHASGADTITPEDIAMAKRSNGVTLASTKIPELGGVVMAGRVTERTSSEEAQKSYVHEEQHVLHKILATDQVRDFDAKEHNVAEQLVTGNLKELADIIRGKSTDEEKARARGEMVTKMEELALIEERQIRAIREKYADSRAADEILAFMREGAPGDRIFEFLTTKKADGGSYDFLNSEHVNKVLSPSTAAFSPEDRAKYPELVRTLERGFAERKSEIFGQEYADLIKTGIEVCGKLQKEGMKNGVIRGVLEHEPLVRWEKVAGRLLEHKPRQLHYGVVKQFEEKFGVHESALENLGAFSNLSDGQQLLVLRNLEQLTLADIKKEARDTQREEWKNTGFWRRAGQMIVSLGMKPEMRTAEIEKELLIKARGEGRDQSETARALAKKLAHIESLAKVAELGPEVNIGAKGVLEVAYASPKEIFASLTDKHLTAEHLKAVELYNDAANAFAKLPQEWGADVDALSWKERRTYKRTKKAYDASREALLDVFETKFNAENPRGATGRAMLAMNRLDEKVTLNQLFNTHPDAEEALADIKDTSTIWRAAKEFWKAKGVFVAYGSAVRAGVVAITGGIAAPIIAAGAVGGLAGYGIGTRQAKMLINERRHDGRMSAEDAREKIEFTTYKKDANGNPELDKKGEKIPVGKDKRNIREFTDANFFVDRIDRLTKKLSQTTDRAEKTLIEKKIAQTNALMKEKLEHGMINFGGSGAEKGSARKGETISNRLAFMQAMAKGAIETNVDKAKLEKDIERRVNIHEARITDVRKKEIKNSARKAAAWRAGFALTGAGIAHYWFGTNEAHAAGRGGSRGAPYDPDASPAQGGGSGGTLYDPDNAPEGITRAPEGRGVEIMIERRVISPQEAEFVNMISKKYNHSISLEEGRALWKTMPLDGSEPTEEFLKNTPAGRAHVDIVTKFMQRGKPLSEEEIAAIFKKEGFDPRTGRPLPDELGLAHNEALAFPSPKATAAPVAASAPTPTSPSPAASVPAPDERGGVDPSWKLNQPKSEAAPVPPPPPPPPHPVPPPPPTHASPAEVAPAQTTTAPVEVVHAPREATIQEVMKSVSDVEAKIGRDLSGGEMITIKSLKSLEVNAVNPAETAKIVSAREALAGAMARKHAPLSPREMYDTLKSFGLEKKVMITPDDELRGVLTSQPTPRGSAATEDGIPTEGPRMIKTGLRGGEPETEILRAPYPGMEAEADRVLAGEFAQAEKYFGADGARPAKVFLQEAVEKKQRLYPPLQKLLERGQTPHDNETLLEFYKRGVKEIMLRTRVPKSSGTEV